MAANDDVVRQLLLARQARDAWVHRIAFSQPLSLDGRTLTAEESFDAAARAYQRLRELTPHELDVASRSFQAKSLDWGVHWTDFPSGPPFSSRGDTDSSAQPRNQRPDMLRARCGRILDIWSVWMPQRLVNEEVGDFLENINRRINEEQSRWLIWTRVIAAMLWLTVHSVGYFLKASGIRKSSGS
jgi:hypothetical protein